MKKLLHLLLAALGFATVASGCDKPEEELLCMYGTPVMHYTVKGRVVDEDRQPINGIKVEAVKYTLKNSDEVIYDVDEWDLHGKTQTDADGGYTLKLEDIGFGFPESADIVFSFEDVDGEANGGEFAKKEETFNSGNQRLVDENGYWHYYYELTLPDTTMSRVGADEK